MKHAHWMVVCTLLCLGSGCRSSTDSASGNGGSPVGNYPRKQVTIICPWAPGGGTDRVSRFWANALQKELGKPFVVVNRTGGGGATGHTAGARARPDGHTITTITFELCTMHRMGITDLTFRDYECLLQMNADPAAVIVRSDAPWETLPELLDHIRENPKSIKMSGTASGGAWDLARAGLQQAAGIPVDSVIWVPKDGANPSLTELLGGHLEAVVCSLPEAAHQLDSGLLRALAVMDESRLEDYPEIPTARELGYDWVAVGWRGLALPKGTPPEIVSLLEDKCLAIARSPQYRAFMDENRFGIKIRDAEAFREFLAVQDAQWKTVVEAFQAE